MTIKIKSKDLNRIWNKVWSDNRPKNYSTFRLFKTKDKINILKSLGVDFTNKRVLDIGCGEGTALFYLQEYFGITGVGVDITESLIQKNQKKAINYPGLRFERGEQKSLNFQSDEFDIVLSWGVVEHIKEYIHALAEARRVLKKDGILVLIQPNSWSFGVVQEVFLRMTGKWRFGEQKNFSYRYLRKILEGLGYYNLVITTCVPYKDMSITRFFDQVFKFFIKYWGHYLYIIARKHNFEADYKESFELFLSHTNEKKVIRKKLEDEIDMKSVNSCLDIGGGNGLLSSTICAKDKILIIEQNKSFVDSLRVQGFKCICSKWENVELEERFDLILVAYSITYLPKHHLQEHIKKMIRHLNPDGKLVILAVDEKCGSWREVHTFFYQLINRKHQSSTIKLKEIMQTLNAKSIDFTTKVFSDNVEQMLQILAFDLCRFGQLFEINKGRLREYLSQFTTNDKIELVMVHWMFVIQNKKY